jgi:hypothetical protein
MKKRRSYGGHDAMRGKGVVMLVGLVSTPLRVAMERKREWGGREENCIQYP